MKLILDENIKEIKIDNFKGGLGSIFLYMYEDKEHKILKASLQENSSIGVHTHEDSSEIIFILSGEGKVIIDETEEILKKGNIHYCPKGSTHTLINTLKEPLEFYAVISNK